MIVSNALLSTIPAGPSLINRDPEILHGTPVFMGTRVSVKSLLDWLEDGIDLEEYLDNFPSVQPEQAMELFDAVKDILQRSSES